MYLKYSEIILDNGMSYKSYQNPNVHSINISLYFRAGVIYENNDVNGISHLLEHLFFRRSGGFKQKELYYEMEKIGGTVRASTYSDFIRFDISISPQYFYPAFNIISAIFANTEWTEEDIQNEKAVVLKQIEYKSSPSFTEYVNNRYIKGLALSKPIMGTQSSVKRFNSKTINLWKKKIFNPHNSCFIITGNFLDDNNEYAKVELSKYISYEEPLNRNICNPRQCFNRNEKSDWIIDTDWNISDILISFDVSKNKNYIADFLSSIIGEGIGSRLSLILREELGITDEVYSKVDTYLDFSKISIEFSTDNRTLISALNHTFDIIASLREEITKEDFNKSKVFFVDNQKWLLDDPRELNFILGWRGYILGQSISDIESIMEKYSNLSCENLLKDSQEILRDCNLIITVTNNKNILKKSMLKEAIASCRDALKD